MSGLRLGAPLTPTLPKAYRAPSGDGGASVALGKMCVGTTQIGAAAHAPIWAQALIWTRTRLEQARNIALGTVSISKDPNVSISLKNRVQNTICHECACSTVCLRHSSVECCPLGVSID